MNTKDGGRFSSTSFKKIFPSAWPKWIVVIIFLLIVGAFVLWGIDALTGGKMKLYPIPLYGWTITESTGGWKADNASKDMKIPDAFDSCTTEEGKGIIAFKGGSGVDIDNLGANCWDKKELKAIGNEGGSAYKIESPDGFDMVTVWTDPDKRYARGLEFYRAGASIGKTGTVGTKDNKFIGTLLECLPREVISGIKVAPSKDNGKDFRVGYIELECSGPKVMN